MHCWSLCRNRNAIKIRPFHICVLENRPYLPQPSWFWSSRNPQAFRDLPSTPIHPPFPSYTLGLESRAGVGMLRWSPRFLMLRLRWKRVRERHHKGCAKCRDINFESNFLEPQQNSLHKFWNLRSIFCINSWKPDHNSGPNFLNKSFQKYGSGYA